MPTSFECLIFHWCVIARGICTDIVWIGKPRQLEKAAKRQSQRRGKNSIGGGSHPPWLDRTLEVFGLMESLAIPSQVSTHRRPIQPVAPSTMTLRRQKKPVLTAPSSQTISSSLEGENRLALPHDSSAVLTTTIAPATSASPVGARHPLQSGCPGREGGVESQDKLGTADQDDGRIRIRHTASEEGSERKGQHMNEERVYGTQQLHQELNTSCRVLGPRTSVSGSPDMASGVAGSSACGTIHNTNTTSRTERRLPKIILKVKPPAPPPPPGAGMS